MSHWENKFYVEDSIVKRSILLIDDSKISLANLKKILQDSYEMMTAKNGEEALEILRSETGKTVSAVVLDLAMPAMDGYDFLHRMRRDKDLASIPIIVAGTRDSSEDKEMRALTLGANDYVTKPYKPEIIKRRIANAIFVRETAAFANTVQHDSVTGLFSKEYFYLQVEKTLETNHNEKFDMVCCDVDRFKLVNDLHGTQIGDELLKYCAAILSKTLGFRGICGRIGPDVFAFLRLHCDDYQNSYFSEINNQINQFGIQLKIILRYGIYQIDDPNIPASLMCDRACLAKASIKGLYGTYFKYYDENIRNKLMLEQYICNTMKAALLSNEFKIYFQPIYDIRSEKIVGAEALVRWENPREGLMPPGEFIPLFEKNGFITDLDLYVWEGCCKKLREWIDGGNIVVPISVNVSRADLYNPNIDRMLLELINKYRIGPKLLHLEITESAYTENSQQIIQSVEKLKKLGFTIEMDDFGSGYSSLNMLTELPIDMLKLDIRFLQSKGSNGRSVLNFIMSLGQWLGLEIIAEGAETAEQIALLRSLDCQFVQGYYFARPMPEDDFKKMLSKQADLRTVPKGESADKNTVESVTAFHSKEIITLNCGPNEIRLLREIFGDDYEIISFAAVEEAEKEIKEKKIGVAVVICSVNEPQKTEMLRQLVVSCTPDQIPVVSIHPSQKAVETAINSGVTDFIETPFSRKALKIRIENAVTKAQTAHFQREKEINHAIVEMKNCAKRDSLTGLLNRAEFRNRVEKFCQDRNTKNGIFLLLDINDFKNINKTYGYAVGDSVIKSVAEEVKKLFFETDIVGRVGGNRFAVFVPYLLEKKELKAKLTRLCQPLDVSAEHVQVSSWVGICYLPENSRDFQTMFENADTAMRCAQRSGKSRCQFYQTEMEILTDKQLEKKAALLLDNVSDAMFVCDAVSGEIIYINNVACKLLHQAKMNCMGSCCYQLFWGRCTKCDRCSSIEKCTDRFYEEDTAMKDGKIKIHIKAKMEDWFGRSVKTHYITLN